MDRSSKMASKLKVNRHLPIEIESNILSRLPVKTLIRFRAVHKSWYSLISSSYFVNLHRLQNQEDNLFAINKVGNVILVADTCSNERSIFEKPYPYPYEYHVVDSCNGLVCVYGQNYSSDIINGVECDMSCISLWNPALRISKTIRHRRLSLKSDDLDLCVGFGFHNETNDYKVISFTNDLVAHRIKEVEIYSLRSDSWRSVNGAADSLDMYAFIIRFGVYVSFHGSYCWPAAAYLEGKYEEARIISFNMGDEVFKEIMLPPVVSQVKTINHDLYLFNYKDSMGMLEVVENPMIDDSYFSHVWVMMEFSEPNSWTKLYKFDQCPFYDLTLLGVHQETELVFLTHDVGRKDLHVLDIDKLQLNTSSTKDIGILKTAWSAIPFSESLVLLNANN